MNFDRSPFTCSCNLGGGGGGRRGEPSIIESLAVLIGCFLSDDAASVALKGLIFLSLPHALGLPAKNSQAASEFSDVMFYI